MPTALMSKSSNGIFAAQVVGRLRGGVDDDGGLERFDQLKHSGAVADVQFVVREARRGFFRAAAGSSGCRPAGRRKFARWLLSTPCTRETALVEISADFRTDESGRSGNETSCINFRRCVTTGVASGLLSEKDTGLPGFCQVLTHWSPRQVGPTGPSPTEAFLTTGAGLEKRARETPVSGAGSGRALPSYAGNGQKHNQRLE